MGAAQRVPAHAQVWTAPGVASALPECEVDIEDWWLNKNPFTQGKQ